MQLSKLVLTVLGSACLLTAAQIGCGDDDSSGTNGSDNTTNGSSTTTTTSTGNSMGGSGGGNTCQSGIDTACEMCAATECMDLALECANESTCDANGEPTAGCLALITCAATNCDPPDDIACVSMECSDELSSCSGDCLSTTQEFGGCIQMNCEMECMMGAGGGGGAGGA